MKPILTTLAGLAALSVAEAAVIDISPQTDAATNLALIEAAEPGDEVVVAPGTYSFRLYLEGAGTEAEPIVIRAADPANRPVWDLTGDVIEDWPGSYGGGDNGRAIWQVTGSWYVIEGIEFRGGTDGGTGDGGGLRMKFSDHLTLRDCLFVNNDNGLQGAGTDTVVEFCEFDRNGLPGSVDGSHNLYIQGGDLTVRYSYIHDAQRSQNMHIRANRAVFEYNWIARATSYMGDMMPCTMDPCGLDQSLVLRGNVIVRGTPTNDGQVFVMHNDQGDAGMNYELTLVNNTVIGNGDGASLVHFSNEDPVLNVQQTAIVSNNVLVDVASVFRTDDPGLSNWTASGSNNWLSDGTNDTNGLAGSVFGADPGFVNLGGGNYVPAAGSPLVGGADQTLVDLVDREVYPDENDPLQWRWRLSAADIGAFESTTAGAGVGPYDAIPDPGTTQTEDTDTDPSGSTDDTDSSGTGTETDSGGCGCSSSSGPGGWWLFFPILLAWRVSAAPGVRAV